MAIETDYRLFCRMILSEPPQIEVADLSAFLFDISVLHDCAMIVTLPRYRSFEFNDRFRFRGGREPASRDRLHLKRIRHESPIEIVTAATVFGAASGGLWALLQLYTKVSSWRLERRKLELEVCQLERKARQSIRDEGKEIQRFLEEQGFGREVFPDNFSDTTIRTSQSILDDFANREPERQNINDILSRRNAHDNVNITVDHLNNNPLKVESMEVWLL